MFQKTVTYSPPPPRKGMMEQSHKETVNHPDHYGGDTVYETIKVIRAWELGFNLGNAVKYISRAGKKNPKKLIEDLEKAIFYIQDEIKHLKEQADVR